MPELGYGGPIETFIHTIPFIFYAIFAVVMVPMFCLGAVPKMGYMKRAYDRVKATGMTYSEASRDLNLEEDEDDPADHVKSSAMDFVLPIGILIGLSVFTGDIFLAVLGAIVTCFVLYIPRKKMSLTRFCDLTMHGFCNLVPTVAVIFFAFVMQEAMMDIDIANYVIRAIRPIMSAPLFPAITFLLVAALNFSTGSVWGIPAIVAPIIMPLCFSIGANPLVTMGAIISGAVLGSHACFYSSATVLTSSCCKIQNMDHALSQLPYAALTAGLSTVSYLICGFVL